MTRSAAKLRAVPTAVPEPQPSYDYEAEQRRRIASIDWSRVHIAADRRAPVQLPDRPRRLWWK